MFYYVLACSSSINDTTLFYIALNNFFYFINSSYNLFFYFIFYFIISIHTIFFLNFKNFIKIKNNKLIFNLIPHNKTNNSYNSLYLSSIYYFYNAVSLKVALSYLLTWIANFIYFSKSRSFYINFLFKSITGLTKSVNWYPIFKRHSIFGYYRINRQRWVELKSEEINYIKY